MISPAAFRAAALPAVALRLAAASSAQRRTPKDLSHVRGFDFQSAPTTGHTGHWRRYGAAETGRDFDFAKRFQLNQVRVLVPCAAWVQGKETFLRNLAGLVRAAHQRGMGAMPMRAAIRAHPRIAHAREGGPAHLGTHHQPVGHGAFHPDVTIREGRAIRNVPRRDESAMPATPDQEGAVANNKSGYRTPTPVVAPDLAELRAAIEKYTAIREPFPLPPDDPRRGGRRWLCIEGEIECLA